MTLTNSTLKVHRLIKAPLTRVFRAWTDPEEMGRWLGCGAWKTTAASIDLRVGGGYRFRMENGGEVIEMCGDYREIDAPTRLVFTWRQEGEDQLVLGETLVTVDFSERREGTEVFITHAGFTDEEQREEHAAGWVECCDEMERLLAHDPQPAS